ncbi:hypothetical protein UB46_08990 [Burkholderiaceae bacterium 16]|nr:hypothetical protein UB46_08990 [Burkholderiaceae bacterium 16]
MREQLASEFASRSVLQDLEGLPVLLDFNGTTGLPVPSTDVRLLRDDGTEAADGEAGEVCVKGPQVMCGYWNKPAENAAAFTSDGYFRTGDAGVIAMRRAT